MYSETDIKNFVITVSNLPEGLDFIYYLLDSFGAFSNKINLSGSELEIISKAVKKEQGEFILELLREHNFDKFIEIQQKRSNEKWKTMN